MVSKALALPLIGLVRIYQGAVSPLLPGACRYTPSCSEYGLLALRRHGAFHGGWLTLKRFLSSSVQRRLEALRPDAEAAVVQVAAVKHIDLPN